MADLNGGHLVARTLRQAGEGHVFTLCGGHILPIYDGCITEGVTVVDMRHEQACAHAADAYARLTRNVGVALVTAGPGVTDAVTGIANAYSARSPVLLRDGEGDERPHPVPRVGVPAEGEDAPRAVVEHAGGADGQLHVGAPPAPQRHEQPVAGQPGQRGARGRVADAELGEQRDDGGRWQRLGPLPPVVAKQGEQEPGRPLRDRSWRGPRLRNTVIVLKRVKIGSKAAHSDAHNR